MNDRIDSKTTDPKNPPMFGSVDWVDKKKGIGTIVPNDLKTEKPLFFNLEGLAPGTSIEEITKSTWVKFDVVINEKGPAAVNIVKVKQE